MNISQLTAITEISPTSMGSSTHSQTVLIEPMHFLRWLSFTWKIVVLAVVTISLITLLVLLCYPRTYRSRAKLLIRAGRESMTLDPTAAATGQTLQLHQTRQNEIETALSVMSSRSLIEAVLDQVGEQAILEERLLSPDQASPSDATSILAPFKKLVGSIDPVSAREKAIYRMDRSLKISSSRDSSVVEIEFRTGSPDLAQRVVASWVQNYIAKHGEFHRTSGTFAFFQQETRQVHEQLQAVEHRLREAKDQSKITTVEGQQLMLENELTRVRSRLNEVVAELAGGQSRIDSLKEQLALLDRTAVIEQMSGSTDSRDTMRSKLYELEVLEQDLASRYTDQHPKLVVSRRQVAEARKILDGQSDQRDGVVHGINPIYQQIETELALQVAACHSFKQKKQTLQSQYLELLEEVKQLNIQAEKIDTYEREIQVLESQFLAHSERLEQARLEDVLRQSQITSVREIQPASYEERPVSPNKLLVIAFGLAAMGCAGLGLPLLRGPDRIRSIEQVRLQRAAAV